MAFTEIEQARNAKALKWFMEQRRPPEHIRPQLDIGFAVVGQTRMAASLDKLIDGAMLPFARRMSVSVCGRRRQVLSDFCIEAHAAVEGAVVDARRDSILGMST